MDNIPEYWIVDLDDRLIERWRPNEALPETLTERLEWKTDRLVESLDISLPEYFRRAGSVRAERIRHECVAGEVYAMAAR